MRARAGGRKGSSSSARERVFVLLVLRRKGERASGGEQTTPGAEHEGSQKLALALQPYLASFFSTSSHLSGSPSRERTGVERYALAFPIRTRVRRQRKRTTQQSS